MNSTLRRSKDSVLLWTLSLRSRVSTVPLKRCLSHAYSSCVVIRCSKKESEISQLLPFLLRLHLPSRFVVLIVGLITGVTNYIMVHPRGGGVGGLNLFVADILTRLWGGTGHGSCLRTFGLHELADKLQEPHESWTKNYSSTREFSNKHLIYFATGFYRSEIGFIQIFHAQDK